VAADVPLRLVLVDPPPGVDLGVQRGRGSSYETTSVQRSKRGDLTFDFSMPAAESGKNGLPNFTGPFAQGPPDGRFVYIDVGTCAGQPDTPWSRRIKIPLEGITWALVRKALSKPGYRLTARIPGTGKDGGPSCATVRPLGAWEVVEGK